MKQAQRIANTNSHGNVLHAATARSAPRKIAHCGAKQTAATDEQILHSCPTISHLSSQSRTVLLSDLRRKNITSSQ